MDSDTEKSYLNDVKARPMIKLSVDGLNITIEFLEIDKRVRAHFDFGGVVFLRLDTLFGLFWPISFK